MALFSGLSKDSSFFTVVLHHKQNAPLDDDPFALAREMRVGMKSGKKKKEPNRIVTH